MVRRRIVRPTDRYFEAIARYLAENGLTQTSQKFSAIQPVLKGRPSMDLRQMPAIIRPLLEELLDQLEQELLKTIAVPENVRKAGISIARSLLREREFFVIEATRLTAPQEPPERQIPGGWTRDPYPIMMRRNVRAADEVIGAFRSIHQSLPKTLIFYGMCFTFLLHVEASIVPTGRKLYAAYLASKHGLSHVKRRAKELQHMGLGALHTRFDDDESTRGLIDETHVVLRNSIGHASFRYEEDLDLGHFVPLDRATWAEIAEKSIQVKLAELERWLYNASYLATFLDLVYSFLLLTDLSVVEITRGPSIE